MADSISSLFVYGTLLFPEMVEALLGKALPLAPAVLSGYRAMSVCGNDGRCEYPAIIPFAADLVNGKILSEVARDHWALLDRFEGNEYRRIIVNVLVEGEWRRVYTYVWRANLGCLSEQAWDAGTFQDRYLHEWVQKAVASAQEGKER